MKLILLAILLVYSTQTSAIEEPTIHRFHGDKSFFKLLDVTSNTILIGGRNKTHSLNLNDLTENSILNIDWQPKVENRRGCRSFTGSRSRADFQCDNYIRFFAKVGENKAILCGTNAHVPECRYYNTTNLKDFTPTSSHERFFLVDPRFPGTATFAAGKLYSAAKDFRLGPLIYSNGIITGSVNETKQLTNDTQFVASFEHEEFVYFFLRETPPGECRQNQTHSRVARVCKNDKGHGFNRWSTFLKARLECSSDGPLIYDQIQSISEVVDGLIYAVFSASKGSGSAVCAFYVKDIEDSFDGPFTEPEKGEGSRCWRPVPESDVPDPRPGSCDGYSTEETFDFIKNHPMMEEPVEPYFERTVLTSSLFGNKYTFTHVTVERLINHKNHHTLFIGTDDGSVIYVAENGTVLVTEETQVVKGKPITELKVVSNGPNKQLIVVSMDEIVSIPLSMRICQPVETFTAYSPIQRTSVDIFYFGRNLLCSEKTKPEIRMTAEPNHTTERTGHVTENPIQMTEELDQRSGHTTEERDEATEGPDQTTEEPDQTTEEPDQKKEERNQGTKEPNEVTEEPRQITIESNEITEKSENAKHESRMMNKSEKSEEGSFPYELVAYVIGGCTVILLVVFLIFQTARHSKVSKRYVVEKKVEVDPISKQVGSNADGTDENSIPT